MAEWEKRIIAINLICGDMDRGRAFYTAAFGMPALHVDDDAATFRFKDTYVFLQQHPEHEDATRPDVLDLARKGVGQFAILVEDVDAVRADLAGRGVALISEPADRDWGMRTMTFADPSGHTWEIAQELPDVPASA